MGLTVWSKERGLKTLKLGVTVEHYRHLAPSARVVKKPGIRALENMMFNGVARAVDGCRTEPDGVCAHGYPSWLIALGVI